MSSPSAFEAVARKFLDTTGVFLGLSPSNKILTSLCLFQFPDPQVKLQLVTELRDNLELVHSPEYGNFLRFLFPVFYNLLRQGEPQLSGEGGLEQKIRNTVLEILNRLPNNEHLRPFSHNLLKLSMYLLEVENEENAVICLRIIIDLHKNYRPNLENEVQAFLDIVQKIYTELPNTVALTFEASPKDAPAAVTTTSTTATTTTTTTATPTTVGGVITNPVVGASAPELAADPTLLPGASPAARSAAALQKKPKPAKLVRSMQSFKVLTECPIIVVLLFQLYPRFLQSNIPKFMPRIVNTLGLLAPPSAPITHHAAYVDFIAAQVKV